jgi:hypothetical protein
MTKSVKNSFCHAGRLFMRRYYLHMRNGVFYAALINQENGLPLTAKSTGTRDRTALKWAHTEGLIPADPSARLTRFSEEATSRDILTKTETEILFRAKWQDRRAYSGASTATK